MVIDMKVIHTTLFREECDFENRPQLPIYVRSCGHYYEIDTEYLTYRPHGMFDYQIIYIESGCLYVGENDMVVPAGSLLLYKPGEPQIYKYKPNDGTSYYWIHFSGDSIEKLLKDIGLYNIDCLKNVFFPNFKSIMYKIVSEIRLKKANYSCQCACYLFELLNSIGRNISQNNSASSINPEVLFPAMNAMEKQPKKQYTLKDYAAMCNMSISRFSHIFKEHTGKSPMQYKNTIIIETAKHLLENSNMSIIEISREVGIPDSLYFSKKFREYTGISPSDYRKSKV